MAPCVWREAVIAERCATCCRQRTATRNFTTGNTAGRLPSTCTDQPGCKSALAEVLRAEERRAAERSTQGDRSMIGVTTTELRGAAA
jgi:hypothetical protein